MALDRWTNKVIGWLGALTLLWACSTIVFSAIPENPGAAAGLAPTTQAPPAHAAETEQHHPKMEAGKLAGGSWITNSMVVTWSAAILLILFAQLATRQMEAVPRGLQNFWEWLVECLYDFLEGILGNSLVKKTFWFFATIFIFILAANWIGLIPGVGTIGWGTSTPDGFMVTTPLLRGANADLNMTLGMALVFFACWIVWALQENGIKGFLLHLFGVKGDTSGLLKLVMIAVFFLVGLIEVVSIMFRPVSLCFRLYGNVFAGENMLETMVRLVPGPLGWLVPIPFYFLELIVGLVQALVFMLLTAVFTLQICLHDENHESAQH
jgi:F-type H+-transporting ATPase subunit a